MRRTISNLSREIKVSRPCIYRAIKRLSIENKGGELSPDEWERLKTELSSAANVNKQKKADAKKIELTEPIVHNVQSTKISDIDASSLKERLACAKQEYDFNRGMITMFQAEASAYFEVEGKTTMQAHNGSMSTIPAVVNLEKYVKLNIALSKLINDLENDLDMEVDGGDDPFA